MDKTENFNQFRRQSKKGILVIYLRLLYKTLKLFWILLFIFVQKFSKFSEITLNYIYIGASILLVFLLIRAILIFKNFQFKIENQHFILKRGILKKVTVSIPFDRIQNIHFKQNIMQQLINVYALTIETAGSSKAEISIKALSFKEANALKEEITFSDSKSIENENVEKDKPLLKAGFLELLKVSLTENHLQSLVLLLAILIGFYQQLNEIFNGLGKRKLIDTYISKNTSAVESSVVLFFALLILVIFVAVLSSVVRVYVSHYNLTVFVKNNALEIDQGLTTKKSVILKKNKVQHITVSHNPVKKKQDKIIKIVGCKKAQVLEVKKLLFPDDNLDVLDKNYPNLYFKLRMYVRSFLFFLVLNLGLFYALESNRFLWMNLLILPIFIFLIGLKYRKRYHIFNENILLIAYGVIETHKTYLPFFKVQTVKLKQTIFQRRRNVADVVLQTAAGKIKIPCMTTENALKMYNYTLLKIETSKKLWM
ncbi:MAG: PH domain-containing protein [Polaribacter sp.]